MTIRQSFAAFTATAALLAGCDQPPVAQNQPVDLTTDAAETDIFQQIDSVLTVNQVYGQRKVGRYPISLLGNHEYHGMAMVDGVGTIAGRRCAWIELSKSPNFRRSDFDHAKPYLICNRPDRQPYSFSVTANPTAPAPGKS